MTTKFVEIRDVGTTIPALAIQISSADGWIAERAGFGAYPCVYLLNLATEDAKYDPYHWPGQTRTMRAAHIWLRDHWEDHEDGAVVDVQFIIGETAQPKESDRHWRPRD